MLRILFTLIILFAQTAIFAQSNNGNKRPKIGLVLSGGGAKGFAYVGILKAMEEAGIRPDFIVGTSIGSIIGGLYAIGYSADQLDTLIRNVEWDVVLSNNVPLTYISFEEKEYYNRYLITLPFIEGKLSLPSGVIEGQMLSDLLNKLTWPAMKYKSFDDFPIPFRCVATDVSTGETIVFKDGSLAKALRASMSIPSAFTAVDLDTTLAVDGGILNNFPVNEVENLGADYIIGLNVSDNMANAKDIGSIAGILTQVSMFESLKRMQKDIDKCDFYIKLDLKGYGVSDFGDSKEILAIGNKIGEENAQRFKDLAKELNIQPHQKETIKLNPDSIKLKEIIIEGNKRVPDKLILSKMGLSIGKNVSQEQVEQAVLRVYGINSFKKVLYNIRHDASDSNSFILKVITDEKPPAVLRATVHYDNLFSAGVVLNFTLRNILGRGSRALFIGDVAENPRFRFDYLKYFGKRERFALNFIYNFLKLDIPQYQEGKLIDELGSTSHAFSLNVRTTHSLRHTFIGGLSYKLDRNKANFSKLVQEAIKSADFNNFRFVLGYIQNSTNDRNYPTKGRETVFYLKYIFNNSYKVNFEKGVDSLLFTIEGEPIYISTDLFQEVVKEFLTPTGYGQFYFMHRAIYHFSNKFQMLPAIALGTTISKGPMSNIFEEYNLGGNQMVDIFDTRATGLNYAELVEPNFIKLALKLQNVLWKNLYIQYGIDLISYYPYVPINDLSMYSFSDMIDKYSLIGYGFQLRYRSIIGPVSFGLSANSRDNALRTYFQIGFSMNFND